MANVEQSFFGNLYAKKYTPTKSNYILNGIVKAGLLDQDSLQNTITTIKSFKNGEGILGSISAEFGGLNNHFCNMVDNYCIAFNLEPVNFYNFEGMAIVDAMKEQNFIPPAMEFEKIPTSSMFMLDKSDIQLIGPTKLYPRLDVLNQMNLDGDFTNSCLSKEDVAHFILLCGMRATYFQRQMAPVGALDKNETYQTLPGKYSDSPMPFLTYSGIGSTHGKIPTSLAVKYSGSNSLNNIRGAVKNLTQKISLFAGTITNKVFDDYCFSKQFAETPLVNELFNVYALTPVGAKQNQLILDSGVVSHYFVRPKFVNGKPMYEDLFGTTPPVDPSLLFLRYTETLENTLNAIQPQNLEKEFKSFMDTLEGNVEAERAEMTKYLGIDGGQLNEITDLSVPPQKFVDRLINHHNKTLDHTNQFPSTLFKGLVIKLFAGLGGKVKHDNKFGEIILDVNNLRKSACPEVNSYLTTNKYGKRLNQVFDRLYQFQTVSSGTRFFEKAFYTGEFDYHDLYEITNGYLKVGSSEEPPSITFARQTYNPTLFKLYKMAQTYFSQATRSMNQTLAMIGNDISSQIKFWSKQKNPDGVFNFTKKDIQHSLGKPYLQMLTSTFSLQFRLLVLKMARDLSSLQNAFITMDKLKDVSFQKTGFKKIPVEFYSNFQQVCSLVLKEIQIQEAELLRVFQTVLNNSKHVLDDLNIDTSIIPDDEFVIKFNKFKRVNINELPPTPFMKPEINNPSTAYMEELKARLNNSDDTTKELGDAINMKPRIGQRPNDQNNNNQQPVQVYDVTGDSTI